MRDGTLQVRRVDTAELRAIKQGSLSYEELVRESEALNKKLKEAKNGSSLAADIDMEAVDELMLRVLAV